MESGELYIRIYHSLGSLKRTIRTLRWIWIISLFLSPFIGFFSILIIAYIEISLSIDWNASFTGKTN
jgi:hypothetical protein